MTNPTWPIWLCGSIAAAAALVGVGLAFAHLDGTTSSQLLVARSVALAAMALFAVVTRAGQGVAAISTVMTLVLVGDAIVYGIHGDYVLMAAVAGLAVATTLSFAKMVRTCAL